MTNDRHVDFYFAHIHRLYVATKSYIKLNGICSECGTEFDEQHLQSCTLGFAMAAVEKEL